MFFGKQKFDAKQLKFDKFVFDVKQLKINKFTFYIKQLKANKFIKSTSDLIISTSNATLEVPRYAPVRVIQRYEELIRQTLLGIEKSSSKDYFELSRIRVKRRQLYFY